jgi:hypothetical protein
VDTEGQPEGARLPPIVDQSSSLSRTRLPLGHERSCACEAVHLNYLTVKE